MSEIILLDNIPSSSQAVNQIIFYKNDSNSQNKTIKTKKNIVFQSFLTQQIQLKISEKTMK